LGGSGYETGSGVVRGRSSNDFSHL